MRRVVKENGLGLFFGAIFLAALFGQAVSGVAATNDERAAEQLPGITLVEYVTSSDFGVDVVENWQSEYLQFLLYIWATAWLVQRGSPESKALDSVGTESDEEQKVGAHAERGSPHWAAVGGWRTAVFSRSLVLLMGAVFLGSWFSQAVAGQVAQNEQRLSQLRAPLSLPEYAASADFWNRTLQNWQSEFLAVGSMAVFAVFLRQRGSPESKPVGEPHEATGSTG